MKKGGQHGLKKEMNAHRIKAYTAYPEAGEGETAQEFFNENYLRTLDYQSTLADNLTRQIENDSHDE